VTKAGGLGFIGAGLDLSALEKHLMTAGEALGRHGDVLPVGIGLLLFVSKVDDFLPILQKYQPAVVWLFAAKKLEDYAEWTSKIRGVSKSQVWIQVGSVAAAVTVAQQAKPDAICAQGADAGGHGFEKGAGIISLLPEVADTLAEHGHGDIPLVAAGGIADGRGAAAAFALGAQGVVLGTRFLAAPETEMHPGYRAAILAASDGGQSTVRAKLFDNLRGANIWPEGYDGRSVVMESYVNHMGGVSIEEIRRLHAKALESGEAGFGSDGKGRAAMWAGTGVGLVKKEQRAAEIVEEIRRGVQDAFEEARARL